MVTKYCSIVKNQSIRFLNEPFDIKQYFKLLKRCIFCAVEVDSVIMTVNMDFLTKLKDGMNVWSPLDFGQRKNKTNEEVGILVLKS